MIRVKKSLIRAYSLLIKLPLIRHIRRARIAARYLLPSAQRGFTWIFKKSEESNFYYSLTDLNRKYMASAISVATGASTTDILEYFSELESDYELRLHLQEGLDCYEKNLHVKMNYGRRIGWYAIVRVTKPRLIVETGVDHGVGACVLASALIRNVEEGFPGRYVGTEINPLAGQLLSGRYANVGEIIYADSLNTLDALEEEIDCFINDSDHSFEYEGQEYKSIRNKLSTNAVLLGDNSHSSTKLYEFSIESGRKFIFVPESPLDHWYPGAGIGISFR
jgi:predicted O-methyltransferase YrrM